MADEEHISKSKTRRWSHLRVPRHLDIFTGYDAAAKFVRSILKQKPTREVSVKSDRVSIP